jgi:hypothetical protein
MQGNIFAPLHYMQSLQLYFKARRIDYLLPFNGSLVETGDNVRQPRSEGRADLDGLVEGHLEGQGNAAHHFS